MAVTQKWEEWTIRVPLDATPEEIATSWRHFDLIECIAEDEESSDVIKVDGVDV